MQTLHFNPFSKEQLIERLREKFPHRKVQTSFGTLQVRTSGFTVTGNVALKLKPEQGTITTNTSLDMVFIYLFLALPLGIYILAKQRKTKTLEAEVVAGLNELLEPAELING